MKYKIIIALLVISIYSYAQTKDNKNNISAGFGTQSYNGDLGNSWFDFEYETYGVFTLNYSRYICNSFDISVYSTYGDYGRCRGGDDPAVWSDGTPILNMHSRLTTGNLILKYKFANGYILKEEAMIAPYLYVGAGANNAEDIWDHSTPVRVNQGTYATLNGGAGVRLNITARFNLTYNIGFAYFTNDNIDYNKPGMNPKNMLNTYSIGYNF